MNLDELLTLKADLLVRNGPPLRAVRMSRATTLTFPMVPVQSKIETLYSVPIEWDDTLQLNEYVPVYVDD